MIGSFGTVALVAGLASAIVWTVLWLVLALSGAGRTAARIATWATLLAAACACVALEWALVTHDFSVRFVAENGGRSVPLYFTITSLWSALDGSLVLWLLILAAVGVILSRGRNADPLLHRAWAMVTVGVVAVFFFALTYFAANPFEITAVAPADGPGPNPLLREHPAMGVHPPLLYAGYVAMVVPFGHAISALVAGRHDDTWLSEARRWTLGAWILLTVGIVLGAWWSYAVLGWGGYWAWDPVENASLLPWLTATAALHITLVGRRGSDLAGWALSLFCCTFVLVLVGTFLTRSGAVASVHSFTESPLGPMLLGFVVLVVALVLWLLLGDPRGTGSRFGGPLRCWSRETGFLFNAVLLIAVAAVVLTGTLYPLVSQLVSGEQPTVDASYYQKAAVPLMLGVMLAMGVFQLVPPRGAGRPQLVRRPLLPFCAGLVAVVIIGAASQAGALALAAFGLAAFVLTGVVTVWFSPVHRQSRPGLLAHAGIAIVALGVAASSAFTTAKITQLGVGESVTVDGVTARLTNVDRRTAADRMTVGAHFALTRDGRQLGTISPVMHYYPGRDMTVGAPAIRSRPWGDIYASVTGVDQDGPRATVRLAVNRFISLIWLGGGLIAAGGILAFIRMRRNRVEVADEPTSTDTGQSLPAASSV